MLNWLVLYLLTVYSVQYGVYTMWIRYNVQYTEGALLPSKPDQLNIAPLTSSKLGSWQPGRRSSVEVDGCNVEVGSGQ